MLCAAATITISARNIDPIVNLRPPHFEPTGRTLTGSHVFVIPKPIGPKQFLGEYPAVGGWQIPGICPSFETGPVAALAPNEHFNRGGADVLRATLILAGVSSRHPLPQLQCCLRWIHAPARQVWIHACPASRACLICSSLAEIRPSARSAVHILCPNASPSGGIYPLLQKGFPSDKSV